VSTIAAKANLDHLLEEDGAAPAAAAAAPPVAGAPASGVTAPPAAPAATLDPQHAHLNLTYITANIIGERRRACASAAR
jgi:hypothetical protein